jgi:outer membrane protein OmpA-like peptidoglycan-associated protein
VYAVTSNVGSAPATSCSGATASNYSFTYVDGSVNVQKKTLTVTASSPSATYGVAASTITVTPLYSNWANSDTSSVIDTAPTCSTAFTNTSAVGSAPYTRCSGGSDNNYSFSFVDGAVLVGAATVTITAENKIATYGTALGQSISVSGLANSDSVDSVVYTYAGSGATSYSASTTRPTAVGGYSITPSSVVLSAGSSSNYSFNYVAGTATINKKGITVTGSSPTVLYGASVPTITPLYSSDFAYGETSSVVSNTACSTVYAVTSNVGSAPATSCSGATASNYSFTYVDGSVNVQKKPISVTASSHSVIYGDAKPTVAPEYSGFVNDQDATAFTTAPTCDTTYSTTSGFGSVASTCSGGSAANYSFTFTAGVISIAKKTLTVTAPSPTVTYGDTAPTLSATITGWVNSETSSVLTTLPTCSTAYTNASNANTAPSVNCAGAVDDNYAFSYVSGAFTINKANQSAVTVSATDAQLTWQPGPGYATTTLVGADGDGDGSFSYAVTSTNSVCSISGFTLTALTAGVCKLTATKAASTNYLAATSNEFSYTIVKAAQTISFATLTAKTYGDASFSISASASSGLIVSFVATAGVCSVGASSLLSGVTTATVSIVAAGNCTITASQSGNINYTAATAETGSALARTFTIARKSLTIQNATASNKVYDAADAATGDLSDASLIGVQFSDDVSITQTGFSATFADANAADNKVVTFTGVTLSGTKAANYSVVQPTATANVTKASSGLAWTTPASVVYGTTLSATQLSATASVEGSFTYTPLLGTLLNAGTRTLSVTFTPTSSNFAAATTTVALVVNQKPVTVTATNRSVVYGNSFTPAFTTTAFVGSDAASAVTYTYSGTGGTAYSASATAPTTRGSYFITPSLLSLSVGDLANYNMTYVEGTLSITQAEQGALTVVASSQSLTFSPIPSPATASLSTLAGSEGSGTGVVSYAVVSGNTVCSISGSTLTALTAGTCSVTVTRDADINFVVKTSEAITITIAKSSQTLTFATISNKTYGDANFSVTPTASSGLTVSLSSATPQVCDIPSALTVRVVDVGTCTVVAAQVGNINYEPATASVGSSTTRSFSVARKVLTVSGVSTVSRIYDGSLDATTQLQFTSAQLDGVVIGDTVSLNSAGASGTYVDKTANTNKAIAISGLALQGTHASRYSVQAPSDVVGTVTQASLTTSGIVVVARAYDGTRTATINSTNYAFAGVFGSDAVVLDASNYGAIYDTATASTSKSVTVSALALSGTDAANYTLVQPMLVGAINKATATVIFSTPLSVVYDATSRSVGTTTTPSALTVVVQYSGRGATSFATSTTGPIDAGNYGVAASINETNYLGTNAADFTIEKQLLPVALETAALTTTFTGRARFVGATTTPSGKQVGVSYQGSGSTTYAASTYAPTNAGTYAVTATIEERNFQGTSTQTLTVAKANQETLSIVNTAPVVYGDTTTSLLAKGGTGNGAITYAKVSGPCTINSVTGAVLTTGVGSCVVRASKAASDNVEAVVSANRTLEIVKAPQEVAFTSSTPSSPVAGDTYQPTAVSSAGLPVSIVVTVGDGTACSRSGSTVTFIGSGVCEITASQAGTALYEAATSVRQSFEVGKMNQSISFPQLARQRVTDPSFMLEASASSGLGVTYVLTSGSSVCALDANGTVSPLSVGTCTITASQAGDSVVAAAAPVARTISIVADVSSAPKITSISGGDAMITVGYLPPSFDGGSAILGYRLTVQPTSGAAVTSSNCDLVARTCVVTGLLNGIDYSVSLSAINAAGAGQEDVAPGTTTPAPVLEAVRNVAGQRNDASMSVTWEDPETFGDGTFDRYELSIREDGGSFSSPVTVQSVRRLPLSSVLSNIVAPDRVFVNTASTRQHTFTGLDNAKTYFVKIVTITTAAISARSSNTAAATLFPLEAPSAPLDVAIDSATGRTATVSWKAPVSDGGSPLIRYTVSSSYGTCALATLLAVKCSVTGLIPGQSFSVNVRAVNSVGQSAATTQSITLPDLPSAPSISNVLIGGLSAAVTWTAPSSNGGRTITNYAVSAINASNSGDVVRCTTTALTCTVNSLKVGTTYNITVRARNSVGEGATSAQFSAQTAKPAPIVSTPSGSTVWQTYRTENAGLSQSLVGLPPAPAKVRIASAGARTKVTATGTKTAVGVITQAIITISSKSKKVLARISVRVSSENPTATVTVPFKSQLISVSVQFANDFGVSTGGPTGVNVREGNTYDSTVVGGKPQLMGSVTGSPVYFAAGSSVLTPSGMKQLRGVAATVKKTAGLVYVTGYSRTDEVRGWAVDALARARAEAVAKYLAKQGVRQWIRFQGAGAMKSDWGDWRDRRVVVHAGGNVGSV